MALPRRREEVHRAEQPRAQLALRDLGGWFTAVATCVGPRAVERTNPTLTVREGAQIKHAPSTLGSQPSSLVVVIAIVAVVAVVAIVTIVRTQPISARVVVHTATASDSRVITVAPTSPLCNRSPSADLLIA